MAKPPINAEAFRRACEEKLTGKLADCNWNEDYAERISFTVKEMRYIYKVLKNLKENQN